MILPGDTESGFSLAAEMREAFSAEGLLAASPDFEYRPEQQEMAEMVGLALERELQAKLFSSADAKEGIAAFVEKRKPSFSGK